MRKYLEVKHIFPYIKLIETISRYEYFLSAYCFTQPALAADRQGAERESGDAVLRFRLK
jgi:hypothetical protein